MLNRKTISYISIYFIIMWSVVFASDYPISLVNLNLHTTSETQDNRNIKRGLYSLLLSQSFCSDTLSEEFFDRENTSWVNIENSLNQISARHEGEGAVYLFYNGIIDMDSSSGILIKDYQDTTRNLSNILNNIHAERIIVFLTQYLQKDIKNAFDNSSAVKYISEQGKDVALFVYFFEEKDHKFWGKWKNCLNYSSDKDKDGRITFNEIQMKVPHKSNPNCIVDATRNDIEIYRYPRSSLQIITDLSFPDQQDIKLDDYQFRTDLLKNKMLIEAIPSEEYLLEIKRNGFNIRRIPFRIHDQEAKNLKIKFNNIVRNSIKANIFVEYQESDSFLCMQVNKIINEHLKPKNKQQLLDHNMSINIVEDKNFPLVNNFRNGDFPLIKCCITREGDSIFYNFDVLKNARNITGKKEEHKKFDSIFRIELNKNKKLMGMTESSINSTVSGQFEEIFGGKLKKFMGADVYNGTFPEGLDKLLIEIEEYLTGSTKGDIIKNVVIPIAAIGTTSIIINAISNSIDPLEKLPPIPKLPNSGN
ncbi:MAG: hypothetical protein GF353_22975 [Candidatus Lokiarchaeota archaeon]|nr:hypothetical protein [Candidatus Lokiarchaeota archaeon]